MNSLESSRAHLELQAEHAFVQLEATIDEIERRRRRALRLAHLIAPLAVLVLSGIFVRWLFHRHQLGPSRSLEATVHTGLRVLRR